MTAIMKKMDNGFFIENIEGFEIMDDVVEVNIDIIDDKSNIYKKQMIDAVSEHYESKRENQVKCNTDAETIAKFRKMHNINITEEAFWDSLK